MAIRTGYKITIYLDDNPLSPTYMQTYEEKTLDEDTCPIPTDDLVLVSNECEIDLSGYTGYRLEIYYNRTTGEYVEQKVEDPECIESSTDEQWINSGSPYCEVTDKGINTGYMLQPQVQMNPNLANYGETRTQRYKSPDCGSNTCALWDDIQKQCHVAVVDCVATFDGTADISQIDINPLSPTYNQTRTINKQDSDCKNCTNTFFSWIDVGTMCGDDELLCSNGIQQVSTNSYIVSQKYKTISETIPPIPMDEYQIHLKIEDDEDCGYIRPLYSLQKLEGQYLCDYETYTKYEMYVRTVSYDGGITWSVWTDKETGEIHTERGEVIAYDSYDCGKPMYRWVDNGEIVCEDNGDDWKLKLVGTSSTAIVPCDESAVLTNDELPSIPNNVSSVDFGNCISQIDCRISSSFGSYQNEATVHFGDYIEVIGKADASSGMLSGYLRYNEDSFDDNLRIINKYAFSSGTNKYSNNTAYLGTKIESIGEYAFRNSSTNLNTLKINTEIPPAIGSNAFYDYDSATYAYKNVALNCILVPNGAVEAYREAWSAYSKYIFTLAEEDTFFRATYSDGTRGWNFSSEGTDGILSYRMTMAGRASSMVSSITDVYLSNEVTEIGDSAFTNAYSLTEIRIPNTVRRIGNQSFYACSGLTSLTIPDSVISIGNNAFIRCSGITGSIIIPDNVTDIGVASFNGCGMSSLHIGSGVTNMGRSSFANCTNLSAVTIAEGVTRLGGKYNDQDWGLFSNCTNLKTISIPSTVTSVGYFTFENCSSLTSINLPNACEYIGSYAFRGCSSLSSVSIGSGNTYIGNNAFENCSRITNLNIGNFTHIGSSAFTSCSGIMTLTLNSRENGEIGEYAFSSCRGLRRINIGSGVTKIEDMAFYDILYHRADDDEYRPSESEIVVYCYATTPPEIGFGSGSATNRPSPFAYKGIHFVYYFKPVVYVPCSSLAAYRASKWNNICVLKPINNNCAQTRWVGAEYVCLDGEKYATEGKEIRYPSGDTWTEWEDTGERRVVGSSIGSCVKAILYQNDGTRVLFDDLSSSVLTSNEVKSYSTTTTAITIGDKCTAIDSYCFQTGNTPFSAVTVLNIENGVTDIRDNAFGKCSGIRSVVIPDSVTTIGSQAFGACGSLTSVTMSQNLTSIGGGAFAWTQLKELTLPNGVTKIPDHLLYQTTGTTAVTLGNAVASIGSQAYLAGIITINTETPPTISSSYNQLVNVSEIRVPCGCADAYKAANYWSSFSDKIVGDYPITRWVDYDIICKNRQEHQRQIKQGKCSAEDEWHNTSDYRVLDTPIGECEQYYDVDLNNQWQQSTSYGDIADTENYIFYESFSNKGVNSGKASMTITIDGYSEFTFKVRNYSESNYDYVVVNNLDNTTVPSWQPASGSVYYTNKGLSSSSVWYDVTFSNIDGNSHTILITYGKDSTTNSNDDRGYIAIPINQ